MAGSKGWNTFRKESIKIMKNILTSLAAAVVGLLLAVIQPVRAADAQWNDLNTAAYGFGNYYVELKAADLTVTNTYVQTVSIAPMAAKYAVECIGLDVVTPFSGSNTNITSLTLSVGDSNSVATFVAANESHASGTPVYWKFATSSQKVYTAANALTMTATAATNITSLATFTQGTARAYFRLKNAGKLP